MSKQKPKKIKQKPMSEADLEMRIRQAIELVLPAISSGRITHQKTFSVRLGHIAATLDGTETSLLQGRLDILLELDGRPLAILEIKRPGEQLDDSVTRQGLSYARVLDSVTLPPLVITTNGTECNFFRTWDGSRWDATSRDEQAVQSLFADAAEASSEDIDIAVQHLLETIPATWLQAVRDYTANEITDMTGDLRDLSKPISLGFNIPRKAMLVVAQLLSSGHNKIALQGEPFSGKTNLFASLCSAPYFDAFCFLYVNLAASSEGIYNRIASSFTSEFFRTFTVDHVKTWIANQLNRESNTKLVVLIDGVDSADASSFRSDLDTLARQANEGRLALVFSGNADVVRRLACVAGHKTPSIIGQNLQIVELECLDDEEWSGAMRLLNSRFHSEFERCADKVYELRLPRILRLLASTIPTSFPGSTDQVAMFLSVCCPQWFKRFWDIHASIEIADAFRRLANGLLEDAASCPYAADALRVKMMGAMSISNVESCIEPDKRKALEERGLLQLMYHGDGSRYYLPKSPEILATALAHALAERSMSLPGNTDAAVISEYLIRQTEVLPYNAITCAMALAFIGEKRPGMAAALHVCFLNSIPHESKVDASTTIEFCAPDGRVIEMDLSQINENDLADSAMICNIHPWLALSYFLTMQFDEDRASDAIKMIGSWPSPLTGLEQSPRSSVSLEINEMPGGFSLLSWQSALLEPITLAIRMMIVNHPERIKLLATEAITERNMALIYRLLMSAKAHKSSTNAETGASATELEATLNSAFQRIAIENFEQLAAEVSTGSDQSD